MKNNQNGLTLIEIITTIALFVFVTYIVMSTNFSSYRGYSFRDERDALVNNLERSRSEAMNNICFGTCTNGITHGIHFEQDSQNAQYIIYQGSDWASHDSTADEVISINSAMQISGPADVIFSTLSGDASVTPADNYDITITDNMNQTSVITINSVGQITWTN